MKLTLEEISQALVMRDSRIIQKTAPLLRRAAVLVPLIRIADEWHLLYTRRTELVQDHKGQVSFPGGARESQDTDLTSTAIRETCEEIGICSEHIQVLGNLPDFVTISRYQVRPVVAFLDISPDEIKINEHEVSRVFTIPLEWLADPGNWDERIRIFPDGREENVTYFQSYLGEIVWGITARITRMLLECLSEANKRTTAD